MITKAPSQYDGKPVGTPTDAKSPWQAGVTMGPDHLERDAIARREAKHQKKLLARQRIATQTQREQDEHWYQHKRRRARAFQWQRQLNSKKRKWTIADLAAQSSFTPDEILAELRWLKARQAKHRRVKDSKQKTKEIRQAMSARS